MCCQVNIPVVMMMSFTKSKLHNSLAPIVGYIMVSNTYNLDIEHTTTELMFGTLESVRPWGWG